MVCLLVRFQRHFVPRSQTNHHKPEILANYRFPGRNPLSPCISRTTPRKNPLEPPYWHLAVFQSPVKMALNATFRVLECAREWPCFRKAVCTAPVNRLYHFTSANYALDYLHNRRLKIARLDGLNSNP